MIKDYGYTPDRDAVGIELPQYDWVTWDRPAVVLNEESLRIRINNLSDAGLNTNIENYLLTQLIKYKREKYGKESILGDTEGSEKL